MANQSVLELAVGTGKWDAGLKKAKSALDNFTQANGGLQQALDKESQKMGQFVRMMGGMESTAKTAKGQMNDYKSTIEQLTMQYNRMTEAQKKVIGQDYLQAIEQMKQKYQSVNEEIQEMNRSLNNVKMPEVNAGGGLFAGLGDKMSGAMQVFAGNMLTKAAGAVANLGSEIFNSVQQGVELARQGEGIRIAFERLGRGDILDGLREATHGTVTDLELMKAAVKFNDFKLPVEELGTMLAFAQQKAKDTGQSVDYMVESLVTGLGRKSLMILDNLGLSATEVKEKMAETGDMTKAVGAIIREQMSKAGDYVETAADRAAQANVSLQNKMEELGRKFAPLEEASNSLWTSMKIGILDIIGGPLATLLNQLTEAGRLKNMLNSMNGEPGSGSTKVDQQLKKLNVIKKGGGSDYIFNSTLNGMMEDYNRQIMALDAQIKNGGKRPGAGSGESQDVKYLQQKMDALKIMRDQLAAGAKEINKPIKIESNIPDVTGGGSGKGGRSGRSSSSKSEPTFAPDSIAAQQKLVADLTRQWNEAGAEVRNQYVVPLVEAEAKLKEMRDQQALMKEQAQGKLLGDTSDGKGIEVPISSNASFEEWMNSVKEQLANLKIDPIEIPIETTNKDVKAITKAASMAADAVGNIGAAFNSIEDPAAKVMGTVLQAIASIALGFAQASASPAVTSTGWGWLAWLGAGTAALATTIATVHSLTGYAEGGMIKGNSYSGDNIGGLVDGSQFVGLNAGEVVLNASQQNMLAQNLQGGGGTVNVAGRLVGEDIFLSADRYARRSGRGGILTGKNL